jgi:hypothetical protein
VGESIVTGINSIKRLRFRTWAFFVFPYCAKRARVGSKQKAVGRANNRLGRIRARAFLLW